MQFYLASRYGRKLELRQRREDLQQAGHVVTSQWLDTDLRATDLGVTSSGPEDREYHAQQDLADIQRADVLIAFTEDPEAGPVSSRGGRHVEFGYALACGRPVIVVGPRENIFHFLPNVRVFATWEEFLAWLSAITAVRISTVPG